MKFLPPKNIEKKVIRIAGEKRNIPLLIIRPSNRKEKLPGVLWIHGGGYLTGMKEMAYMSRAIDLEEEGAVLVCPGYSLSVFHPYPEGLMDCHHALVYLKDHCEELGVDPGRIMVGGESAGGGLTAALCMYELDHDGVKIACQMPLYPMLDCYDTESSRDNHEKVWNTPLNHFGWKLYLRKIKGDIPEYASPSRRKDYHGLPPCYTFVGDIEPFYCETVKYIEDLKKASVEAYIDVYKGFYHAKDMMEDKDPEVLIAKERFLDFFRYAKKNYRREQS